MDQWWRLWHRTGHRWVEKCNLNVLNAIRKRVLCLAGLRCRVLFANNFHRTRKPFCHLCCAILSQETLQCINTFLCGVGHCAESCVEHPCETLQQNKLLRTGVVNYAESPSEHPHETNRTRFRAQPRNSMRRSVWACSLKSQRTACTRTCNSTNTLASAQLDLKEGF